MNNLFEKIPDVLEEESFQDLLVTGSVRIERIISHGHSSPEGFWYDQDQDEWVMLLQGAARIRFEEGERALEMKPGDFVHIPAHQRHRVEWTKPDAHTIWLAVHHPPACDA